MPVSLRVWDVRHGSAAYIRTPNGKHIVVDCGSGKSFSPLLWLLSQLGQTRLNMAIITHPHVDHISDILSLSYLSPRILVRPSHLTRQDILANNKDASPTARHIIEKYLEFDTRYVEPVVSSEDPTNPTVNGGAQIYTFIPTGCPRTNLNNHSVVTIIEYAGCKILLPGDNEPPSWDELLSRNDFTARISGVDVLVAPHHGRDSGFHGELFDYFKPRLTIISDGRSVDTSATDRYSRVTTGWPVYRRNGSKQSRKCVTTRKDGTVDVEIGWNGNSRPFISVTVD